MLVNTLARLCAYLLDGMVPEQRGRVGTVGVALPGVVDSKCGIAVYSANLGLQDAPIGEPLSHGMSLPVQCGQTQTRFWQS